MSESGKLTLRCPDCNSHLVVDSATGEVLSHRLPDAAPADGKDLSALLDDLEQQKEQAEDIFSREMEALKDRDRLLDEAGRVTKITYAELFAQVARCAEALKRAEEEPDDEPPVRPFDLD